MSRLERRHEKSSRRRRTLPVTCIFSTPWAAPAVGAGLALGLAERFKGKVVALEGDGGLLMGFSILATLAHLKPANLIVVILDDGVYTATGGQRSGSEKVDFCGVARACGFEATDVGEPEALASALGAARITPGPHLIRVRIDARVSKRPHYLPDPPTLTDRFQRYIATLR